MLMPKRVKWRKVQRGRMSGPAKAGRTVAFGEYGLATTECAWVTARQIEAARRAITRAAELRAQGLEVALTTHALADRKVFRKNLRLALDRGLSEADALAALTTIPAKLCGVADRLGTIEPGKIANLTVVEGAGYFDADAKVLGLVKKTSVTVNGDAREAAEALVARLKGRKLAGDANRAERVAAVKAEVAALCAQFPAYA